MSASTVAEPAIKSYFFGKGYVDLRNTIVESWTRNLASARVEFACAGELWPRSWWHKALAVLRGSAGVSIVLFGTLFFVAFSVLHVALLGAFFLVIYVAFSAVYLAERGFLAWRHFSTVCPECHGRAALPEYFCRKCGEVHRRLIPSPYGTLHHTCTCGEQLPATFFLRRSELRSRCPQCGFLLAAENTEARKVFLPVFGGPAVGKSAYLHAAVAALIDEAGQQGLTAAFVQPKTEGDFARATQQLAAGIAPDKTTAALPRAWNLRLQRDGVDPRLLYLYDPAGEAFAETVGLARHSYQQYLSGMLVLVDPFTFPALRDEYLDQLTTADAPPPSLLPTEDVLSRILIGMEEHFGLGRMARIKKPVALVLNKVDAFDLEQRIGEPAVQARMRASASPILRHEARDQLLRDQLIRWGQADLVQQLDARCARLRYFTCSALGRTPDDSGRAFSPRGVLEPLEWLLSVADPQLLARPSRGPALAE